MARSASTESVFHAIACPTRRALLDTLTRGESNVTDLVATLDVTQSAVSQQLAVLRSAGLVEERIVGRFRYYRLRVQPLTAVESWVSRYRAYIEDALDDLGRVLDAMPNDSPRKKSTRKKRRRQTS